MPGLDLERPLGDRLVLREPARDEIREGIGERVGGHPSVNLMKGPFSQQDHQLGAWMLDRPPEEIEVQAAAGSSKRWSMPIARHMSR